MADAIEKAEKLSSYDAVLIAEGAQEAKSKEQYILAWQTIIDSGLVWELQGWFGRTAESLIEQGHCTDPREKSRQDQLVQLSGLAPFEVVLAKQLWPGLEKKMTVAQQADYFRRKWANLPEMARLASLHRQENGGGS
jgi:hypothetical protein